MRTVAGHALKGATRRLLGVLFPVFFILSSRGMLPKMVGGGGGEGSGYYFQQFSFFFRYQCDTLFVIVRKMEVVFLDVVLKLV